jgi:hypothetical protein
LINFIVLKEDYLFFPMIPGDASEIVEDLSSSLLVKRELEQLVFKKHLDYENLSLLTDFLVKHPSVRLKDTLQVYQDTLQKVLDSRQQVTMDVEVLCSKIEALKHQLTSSEAVLKNITQQDAAISAPIGY